MAWDETFAEMKAIYAEGIDAAVRSQRMIGRVHEKLKLELEQRLTRKAQRNGVYVKLEAPLHTYFKNKNVDVAVIDPYNGPLITCGVRSQMTSIGNNVLNYTQDIMGEAISLQDRFPMSVYGYVYLMPLIPSDTGRLDYPRYARIFGNISGRDERNYKNERGRFDHFAYAVVDFDQDPPALREDLIAEAQPDYDLRLTNITERLISTFSSRSPWLDYFRD